MSLINSPLHIALKNKLNRKLDDDSYFAYIFSNEYDKYIRQFALTTINQKVIYSNSMVLFVKILNGMKQAKITGNKHKFVDSINTGIRKYWKSIKLDFNVTLPSCIGISTIINNYGIENILIDTDLLLITEPSEFVDKLIKKLDIHIQTITGIHKCTNLQSGATIQTPFKINI